MAPQIKIRQATTQDAFALRRLAQLDDSRPLKGEVLIAEEAGEMRAALSIDDGRAIANPFARTADLVDMLRIQRDHVDVVAA